MASSPDDDAAALELVRAGVAGAVGGDADEGLGAFLSDQTLRRYLVANEGDTAKAAAQLTGSWRWRVKVQPQRIACELCSRDPMSHSLRPVGFDAQGRLLMYTCFATAHDRFDPHKSVAHLTRVLEDAQVLLDADGSRAAKWVLFIDFHGYSMRDSDPRAANNFVWLLQHYPERLGLAVIYNSGILFDGLWRGLRRILNPVTVSKVSFISSMDTPDANVLAMGSEMVAWLKAEVATNRTTEGRRARWWETHDAYGLPKSHDARGVASFVHDAKAYDSFEHYAIERFVDAHAHLPDPAVLQLRCI
ncbi:CRAL-TRIO domain-containing protein [Pavlovales sp. CCMP2436]|nr:CRAL-TRIO domain-containing protein [Pavlovales sp. CCMP2436]|mmetsp:Transcript_11226/g.28355  ORF Transcript_11226/g.28355 Transcript_11226/m.28355 type:complete len:304 (-) Transcript_11226:54-965(-)